MEAIGVVTRSLSHVLERVWVNYFMVIIALLIPEQTLSRKNIFVSTGIVLALTFVVLLIRDILINAFTLRKTNGNTHGLWFDNNNNTLLKKNYQSTNKQV